MINFPDAPTNGQQFTGAGATWQYDGTKWLAKPAQATTTLTGDVTGSGTNSIPTTTTALQGRAVVSTAPTTNQVLQWSGTQWAPATVGGTGTVTSITAGTGITLSPSPITASGSVALTVPVSVASGGSGATTAAATPWVQKAGDTMTGALTVNDPSTVSIGSLVLNAASDANGVNLRMTGNGATTPSKTIRVVNGNIEVTNNAYSVALLQLTDAGNLTATGEIISSHAGVGFRLTSTYGTLIYSDPNSFYILLTNSGDPYGGFNSLRPFSIGLNTGNVYMGHSLSVTGTTSSSVFNASSAFQFNGANLVTRDASTTYISDGTRTCLQLLTGNANQYFANVHYFYTSGSTLLAQFQNSAPYCYKPGGGTWGDTSDRRIKENVRPYTRSLDAIRALQCVTYQHNGRGETTRDGQTYIGLVADDVEDIMPEMVGRISKKLDPDDPEPTELRTLDATALIYALVNAVKELASRLEQLEAR